MNVKVESQSIASPKIKTKQTSIMCPNAQCKMKILKNELENHLLKSCPGTILNCSNQNFGCHFKATRKEMISHEWQCNYRQKSPESSLTSVTLSSTSSVFQTDANGSQDVLNPQNGIATKQIDSLYPFQTNNFYTPLNYLENDLSTEDVCLTITNINRLELGLSFVGGYDTPLQCIVVQEIFRDGLIAQDARLRPGDQLVKVNEYNLSRACHNECRDILNRICTSGDTIYLTVHRDSTAEKKWPPPIKEEILTIILDKPPGKKIGLKLAGKTNKPGLYIQEVLPDTLASQDGKLKKDDRILKINDEDFVFGTQEEALLAMKNAQQRVSFKISRFIRPQTPDLIRAASSETNESETTPLATSLSFPGLKNTVTIFGFPGNVPSTGTSSPLLSSAFSNQAQIGGTGIVPKPVYREEVIEVIKKTGESLGMSVAGGVNSQRGDTPVYITSVAPGSCLLKSTVQQQHHQNNNINHNTSASNTGSNSRPIVLSNVSGIAKGDILLAVNDTELLGLSHERAVESLLMIRENSNKVTVRVLKVPNVAPTINSENFIPTWLYWLRLPSYCQIPRTITLARDPITGSIGFSIVGGNDLVNFTLNSNGVISDSDISNMNQTDLRVQREPLYRPIMIKSIVCGSPAHKNGRLKCGDILVSINNHPLTNVAHSEAVNLFKCAESPLHLKLVSWPGTIV